MTELQPIPGYTLPNYPPEYRFNMNSIRDDQGDIAEDKSRIISNDAGDIRALLTDQTRITEDERFNFAVRMGVILYRQEQEVPLTTPKLGEAYFAYLVKRSKQTVLSPQPIDRQTYSSAEILQDLNALSRQHNIEGSVVERLGRLPVDARIAIGIRMALALADAGITDIPVEPSALGARYTQFLAEQSQTQQPVVPDTAPHLPLVDERITEEFSPSAPLTSPAAEPFSPNNTVVLSSPEEEPLATEKVSLQQEYDDIEDELFLSGTKDNPKDYSKDYPEDYQKKAGNPDPYRTRTVDLFQILLRSSNVEASALRKAVRSKNPQDINDKTKSYDAMRSEIQELLKGDNYSDKTCKLFDNLLEIKKNL